MGAKWGLKPIGTAMLEISKDDVLARMRFDNPWWSSAGPVPFESDPRRKYFAPFFQQITNLSVRRAVVVMGPRRVGKTVMVFHAVKELLEREIPGNTILYLSLETPLYTGLSLEQLLNLFLLNFGHTRDAQLFVFFDEVQYLRNWETHLKSLVDSYPSIRFVATGSAAAALRLKSNESGAGRFTDFVLPPLTFAEFLQFTGKEESLIEKLDFDPDASADEETRFRFPFRTISIGDLNAEFVDYLNFGGYPEAVFNETIRANPEQYIKSDIIDKVLLRDLPSLYGINDIQELNRLFTVLAYNTGNEVSLEGLSKSSGVAKNTIKRYLDYLEAAFLIRRVERIDQNAARFKRAVCFKVYLTNPSMRAALFGKIDSDAAPMGPLTETAIYSQWQHGKNLSLYYARWKDGEVDIVCLDTRTQKPLWMVEVKWSDRPHLSGQELSSCLHFVTANPAVKQPVLVTTRTVRCRKTVANVDFQFLPSSLYAYVLGTNLLRSLEPKQSKTAEKISKKSIRPLKDK